MWQGNGQFFHVWDILREFLGHDFVFGLRTLKPKKPEKAKNLKKTSKNLGFFQPCL